MNELKKPHETDIERMMREEFERRKISFIQFYPHRLGFVMDFAVPDKQICIECDGEKWHRNKKRDNFRDYMLKRSGWKTIRLKESEIKNNAYLCGEKIQNCLLKASVYL